MYRLFFKRFIDVILSLVGFILLSPVFLVVLISLAIANRGRPFFSQPRPGKNEVIFNIIKFKTMNDLTDSQGNLLPDSKRLTRIGKIVRRASLDELPQLINVIKGDMSIIGPRPLRTYYLPLYSERQNRRHLVRPGITGWAQVNGRNTISWTQKFEYDIFYVDNITFVMDMKIVLMTIFKVFAAKDVNANKEITMERFNGNN